MAGHEGRRNDEGKYDQCENDVLLTLMDLQGMQ